MFHMWHHVSSQKVSDFEAFQMVNFWIRNAQPVLPNIGLICILVDNVQESQDFARNVLTNNPYIQRVMELQKQEVRTPYLR